MKKKERARKRKQGGSIRPGQKVLVKISTNNRTNKNCVEYKVKEDYLLPFGVVGVIKDFLKKGGKEKKVIGYLVELQHPVPKSIEHIEDLFQGEISTINRFFRDSTVIHDTFSDKYYVKVHKDICCFLL